MKKLVVLIISLFTAHLSFAQTKGIIQQAENWYLNTPEGFLKKLTPKNCDSLSAEWDKAQQLYSDGKDFVKVPVRLTYKPTEADKKDKKSKKGPDIVVTNDNIYLSRVDTTFDCVLVQVMQVSDQHLNIVTLTDGNVGKFFVKRFDDILPLPKPNWYFEQPRYAMME
ncbi:hypothetical protein [Solitalea canadensis]|uniref:DUF3828 domain-containing protein n=1 Tax=Solitalea canadensis (strain ATCC 29591 / DSM 3403 / JCM 21819 / LMG 8368 / NBRC 15130 / NCIMB 12057 / USAM 9D) TaxID=929556 RepID=H8KXE6_SOLCM|nr:hypothetical protein [Solitalea canadensis]AFD08475.1 hypothetical protein Solca_3470 [Solitalea canadensis DSM 3403]